jgi:hypothetical protein
LAGPPLAFGVTPLTLGGTTLIFGAPPTKLCGDISPWAACQPGKANRVEALLMGAARFMGDIHPLNGYKGQAWGHNGDIYWPWGHTSAMGTYISHGDRGQPWDIPPPLKVRGPCHMLRGVAGSWGQRSAMGMNIRHGDIPPTKGQPWGQMLKVGHGDILPTKGQVWGHHIHQRCHGDIVYGATTWQ